jgi:hypothetical protein
MPLQDGPKVVGHGSCGEVQERDSAVRPDPDRELSGNTRTRRAAPAPTARWGGRSAGNAGTVPVRR